FRIDGVDAGTPVALVSGVATYSSTTLTAAAHTVDAVYSGDDVSSASTATLSQTVNLAAAQTTLISSANPSPVGQAVTFTATLAPVAPATPTPRSTDLFRIDGVDAGTPVALVNGVATYSSSTLTAINHTINAVYSGDTSYVTSTAALSQAVKPVVSAI